MGGTASSRQDFRATITRFMTVGFAALLGVVISTGVLMGMSQRQTRWITHTYETQREIAAIRLTASELIRVRLSNRLHAAPHSAEKAAALQSTLDGSIATLNRLTRDNPRQHARIPLLLASASQLEHQAGLDIPVEAGSDIYRADASALITQLCTAMQAEENQLMVLRNRRQAEIGKSFFVILGLTGLLLVIVGALTYTTIRSYTREIIASRQALHAANSGLEAAVHERTAELMRANGEIQRFVYIVSHDLRSPLVNIMGFTAELEGATKTLQAQMEAALAERPGTVAPAAQSVITEDLPEAIHFIRSSTQKMDRLINAILQLSRLGRRTLTAEWLDLEKLVHGITETLQLHIKQAGATIDIAAPMPDLFCDRVALEQMLANLIENAIKYRHKERALHVRVSAESHGERVSIVVADNGRGIEPRDNERVFDLFRRSGTQDQPGEGIGLAHVRALAYRMGGTVALNSEPGVGSTFTLSLPVHFSEEQSLQA